MKTLKTFTYAMAIYIFLSTATASATELHSEAHALRIAFPEADSMGKKVILNLAQIKKKQKLSNSKSDRRIFRYMVATKNGGIVGYAVVETVWVKNARMTIMVALHPDLTVKRVQILTYANSSGKEVRQNVFLSQFKGKGIDDTVRVGRDIDAITGATISSHAITDEVRRIISRFSTLVP